MVKLSVIALGLLAATNAFAGDAEWNAMMRDLLRSGDQLESERTANFERRQRHLEAWSAEINAEQNAEKQAEATSRGLNRLGDDLERQNLFLCCPH